MAETAKLLKQAADSTKKTLPTDLLEDFNYYFKKNHNKDIVEIDRHLQKPFDFQIQRFEDAVAVFKGSIPLNRFSHIYLALVTKGRGIKTISLTEFEVKPDTLMIIPAGIINSSRCYSANTEGFILSFNPEFLLINYADKKFLSSLSIFKTGSQPFLYLTGNETNDLQQVFEFIVKEYLNYNERKDELIRLYIFELLYKTERIYNRHYTAEPKSEGGTRRYENEFKQLVEQYYLQEKQVSFYADKLNIHPNHLNAIIKSSTGKTCSEWIHQRVLLEAKCLLKFSELSVKEIANYLSFEDAAYFSKYFKKFSAITPLDYRNNSHL